MTFNLDIARACIKKGNGFVCRSVPHSPNRKMFWAEEAKWKKAWEEEVKIALLTSPYRNMNLIGKPTVQVSLYTRTLMDADNAQASLKPIYDGLVKCGILKDDSPEHVNILSPISYKVEHLDEEGMMVEVSI